MKNQEQPGLIRALGLGALIIYGVGDILGAGIYTILGKVAGFAGHFTWLSFLCALGIVFLTALTYSELSSRYPVSGGVSVYIQNAFNHRGLSLLAGLLLFCATLLSMSTLSHAFVGYLASFRLNLPNWLSVFFFLLILLLINIRGIKQSSLANILSTSVEISGLFMVLGFGLWFLSSTHPDASIGNKMPSLVEIFQGAALAFFAFTGFEDLANVAEEAKQPHKNLPRAILSSIGAAGLLYLSVSWVVTSIMPAHELNTSQAPLLDVIRKSYPPMPSYLFSIIAVFAVFNTTLLNYITASRLLYGMSAEKLLPNFFLITHKKYHTPYLAIAFIFPLVLTLSLTGTLTGLAGSTSTVVLIIFSLSSLALAKIKFDENKTRNWKAQIFRIPSFIPYLAIVLNCTAILFLPVHTILLALIFIGIVYGITLLIRLFSKD